MDKRMALILMIVGIILIGYGIYAMVIPETQISIGDLDIVKEQDNKNAYITIWLGIIALLSAFLGRKKT